MAEIELKDYKISLQPQAVRDFIEKATIYPVEYQRKYRPWNRRRMTEYVVGLLSGTGALDPFLVRREEGSTRIADGQHRDRVLRSFFNNEWKLDAGACDRYGRGNWGDLLFKELTKTQREMLLDSSILLSLIVVTNEDLTDDQKVLIEYQCFRNKNSGTPLREFEKIRGGTPALPILLRKELAELSMRDEWVVAALGISLGLNEESQAASPGVFWKKVPFNTMSEDLDKVKRKLKTIKHIWETLESKVVSPVPRLWLTANIARHPDKFHARLLDAVKAGLPFDEGVAGEGPHKNLFHVVWGWVDTKLSEVSIETDNRRLFTTQEKETVLQDQGGVCAICSSQLPIAFAEGHHIKRFADGGTTDISNLQVVCKACHEDIHNT